MTSWAQARQLLLDDAGGIEPSRSSVILARVCTQGDLGPVPPAPRRSSVPARE